MYIESVRNRGSPPAVLLRESYREGGKVCKRTLANLSCLADEVIEGLKVLLRGGAAVANAGEVFTIERSLPHGHVAAVLGSARGAGATTWFGSAPKELRPVLLAMLVARVMAIARNVSVPFGARTGHRRSRACVVRAGGRGRWRSPAAPCRNPSVQSPGSRRRCGYEALMEGRVRQPLHPSFRKPLIYRSNSAS